MHRARSIVMLTKARIAGHPVHPMLIAFPVALYVATAVALIVYGGTHDVFWYRAAFWTNLSGVVMAGVAALPGLVDLVTLPSHTRARRTGYIHAGLNVAALALFVISVCLLGAGYSSGSLGWIAPLVLAWCGVAVTVGAGWFGWTLVQTHHVGVKPTQHAVPVTSREQVDDLDELILPPAAAVPATETGLPLH